MSRSDRQIDDMLDALVSLARKEGKGKERTCCGKCGGATQCIKCGGDPVLDQRLYAVETLAQRFKVARTRDKAGSPIPDGYPRGSSYDGPGGGMQHEVPADAFEGQSRIGLTSVELAIEQRVFSQKSIRDHHHDLYVGAESDLERAVRAIDEMRSKLARIDNLVDQNPDAANATKGCRSHERIRDALGRPYFEPAAREDGGRDGLCRFCYGFLQDHGGLPTPELLDRKIRKGVITNRDIEETRKRTA